MKKLLIAVLLLTLVCSCAPQPEIPAEPQWHEAFRDDAAVICALPAQSADGGTVLHLRISCVGGEAIVLSSMLCVSAQDEYGGVVALASAQGFDGAVMPGQTRECTLVFARAELDGCVVSLALDYAAGRWIALNLT